MTPGTLLLATAFLALVSAMGILVRAYVANDDRYAGYVKLLLGGAFALLFSALLHLTYQFVTTDYSNAYVWHNTADYLPLLYRVTGVYAGNEGSILLWATTVSFVAFAAATYRGMDGRDTKLVHAFTVGIVAYFTGMLLLNSPFAPVGSEFPNAPPGYVPTSGQGLNPLLVDPYMAIHPPVMFTSYALLAMPFAIGAAHFVSLLRGNGGLFSAWIGSVTRWLRLSWLFLTGAVALGGLWSYTVLGWGGIWAWDPVETAILVPWLFLTATMHAVTRYRPDGEYQVLAPAMTATTFSLAVYTTSVVRSGVFRSIHSFASGGIGVSLLVLMGITTVLGVVVPFGYWLARDGDGRSDDEWLTRSTLLHGAVLVLGLLTFVSLWGLSFPVLRSAVTGIEVSVEARYYNLWSYPLVVAALLLLGFYMDFDVEGKRRSLVGLGVFATGTVVAAFVAPSETWRLAATTPTDSLFYRAIGSVSALSVVPPVAYVCLSMLKRASVRIPAAAGRDAKLKEVGITSIHVGVALLVLSLPLMYLFAGQASVMASGVGAGSVDSSRQPIAGTDYSVRVLGYSSSEFPRNPPVDSYALSPREVISKGQSLNGTAQTVTGTVTDVRQGSGATVVQLDDSSVWVGITGANGTSASVQEGQRIVAKGRLMWEFVSKADAMVLTQPSMVGSVRSPPDSVVPTRVVAKGVSLDVYRDGQKVTSGVAGQRRYVEQGGMQVRDVVIERGLVSDTYVIVGVSDGTASITVKRIPMMTAMRLSLVLLLAGMSLVLLYDPAHGVRARATASDTERAASTGAETAD